MKVKRIYINLEGVLSDFEGRVKELWGIVYNKDSITDNYRFWDRIRNEKHFYASLTPLPGSLEMVARLYKTYGNICEIVSELHFTLEPSQRKCICAEDENIFADKIAWIQKFLPIKIESDLQFGGTLNCKDAGYILIDYREEKIKEWQMKGGTGILYKNPQETIARLQDIEEAFALQNKLFADKLLLMLRKCKEEDAKFDFAFLKGFLTGEEEEFGQGITGKGLVKNIEKSYIEFDEVCRNYKEGLLTKEDFRDYFTGVFHAGFGEFIANNNLKLIIPSIQSRWERFEDDYHLWKSGQQSNSNKGDIWLMYLRDGDGGICAGDEASHIDKERFFLLMEAFDVPTDYYKPAPEGIATSGIYYGFSPFMMIVGGGNYWQDDGGLLKGNFQLGSEVILIDRYGLKATITVTKHLTLEEKKKRKSSADFVGIGHIEGYTTTRDREIEISIHKGSISSLYTEIDIDDKNTFSSFPLWHAERQYYYEQNQVVWNVVENLIRRFLKDSYSLFHLDDDEYPGFIVYKKH